MTTYHYMTIHVPGSTATIPQAIARSGAVTGYFSDGSHYQGFIYNNGVYTTIAPPGSTDTFPQGINGSGEVAGYDANETHSFIYNNGVYTTIAPPGAQVALALGINDSGAVTGYFSGGSRYEGFIYNNGVYTTLDVPGSRQTFSYRINASGEVTGYFIYSNSDTDHGFIYNNGVYTTLDVPGATATFGLGINDSGEVTGYFDNGSQVQGFIYNNGVYTTLDVPGSIQSRPSWINNSGEVTGYFDNGSQVQGFVYNNGVYTTLDVPGSTQTAPQWINDAGEVTGNYTTQSGQQEGFIAIPRPPAPTLSAPADGAQLNNNRPAISGTGEANDLATIYLNGNVAGTTTTDATGHWSFTPRTALPDGSYSAEATETDGAGNTSDFSNIDTFTIDTSGMTSQLLTLWDIGFYEKTHHGTAPSPSAALQSSLFDTASAPWPGEVTGVAADASPPSQVSTLNTKLEMLSVDLLGSWHF